MNVRYLGKTIQKNEFGDIIYKSTPCVEVNMEETEVDRFHRIMKWILDNFFHYIYDVYGYVGVYEQQGRYQLYARQI